MSFEDPEVAEFIGRERSIILKAESSVLALQTMQPLPVTVGEEMVIGFYRRISKKPLSREEARFLARRDLADLMNHLRGRIAPLIPAIGEIRCAALLHIGLILNGGTGRKLEAMKDLWPALKRGDYETAHDLIMLSDWPSLVGIDQANRRRVLALARMLRTGEMPAA